MDREQKQAHLTLHGWEPINIWNGWGLYHSTLMCPTYSLGPNSHDPLGQRVNTIVFLTPRSARDFSTQSSNWRAIPEEVFGHLWTSLGRRND